MAMGQAMTAAMGQATPASVAQPAPVSAQEITDTIEKLHGLVGKGVLTQAEFDAKKAELLKKLV